MWETQNQALRETQNRKNLSLKRYYYTRVSYLATDGLINKSGWNCATDMHHDNSDHSGTNLGLGFAGISQNRPKNWANDMHHDNSDQGAARWGL
jgi:hypothetical protein